MATHFCKRCKFSLQAPAGKKIRACPKCGYAGGDVLPGDIDKVSAAGDVKLVQANTGIDPRRDLLHSLQKDKEQVPVIAATKDVQIGEIVDTRGMSKEEISAALQKQAGSRGEVIVTVAAILTIITTLTTLIGGVVKERELTKRAAIKAEAPCPARKL